MQPLTYSIGGLLESPPSKLSFIQLHLLCSFSWVGREFWMTRNLTGWPGTADGGSANLAAVNKEEYWYCGVIVSSRFYFCIMLYPLPSDMRLIDIFIRTELMISCRQRRRWACSWDFQLIRFAKELTNSFWKYTLALRSLPWSVRFSKCLAYSFAFRSAVLWLGQSY